MKENKRHQKTLPRFSGLVSILSALSVTTAVLSGCTSAGSSTQPPATQRTTESTEASAPRTPMEPEKHIVHVPKEAAAIEGVTLDSVVERPLEVSVTVTGEVLANANTQTHVTTPVTGRVTKILVSIGDHIPEGKPLLVIRSTDVQQAESDLMQGEQQVRSDLKQALVQIDCDTATAEASVKLDQKVYQRLKSLFDEKIASQADLQQAETQLMKDQIALSSQKRKRDATLSLSTEKMKLTLGPAKNKLRLLGVSDAEIEEVMKTQIVDPMVPVLAPEDGIITERLVNVGELVDPSKPLFTIGDFHSVWLKADVFEKDIPKVHIGQPIDLLVDSFPDKVFHGKLDYVANQIDADTRTLAVRAEVANPQSLLKPKMFARMRINVGQHTVLSIPKTAVQDASTEKVVYVAVGPDTFEERKVDLGAESGDYVEVLGGLKPNERVATKGSFDLRAEAVRTYG
ncbi:MAG TPA: efflux RND transporter periplasmic adaptor subunit [Oculatellaceae cyanobacterium]